jgi:ubiquinone/menaquinone biosynthesis C-methylase UbiE
MTSKNDTSNLFQGATFNEDYWTNYLEARPEYSKAFYESIYSYHKTHGNTTTTALDIGTGPGQVALELTTHFDHVIASDNNSTHLQIAEQHLASLIFSNKVEIMQCGGEEVAQHVEGGSVDLVTAAECISLMDTGKAVDAFATVLKTSGTVAMWFYGRPYFAEEGFKTKCQPLLEKILDGGYAGIIKGGGPMQKLGW